MKYKIVLLALFCSSFAISGVREYRPDFENIDKYKVAKKVAGVIQEFNNITPSYSYIENKEKSHIFGVNVGFFGYRYNKDKASHDFTISKNLSEFLDTTVINKYYLKLKEFYDLKDKRKKDYKEIIDAYFDYIYSKKVVSSLSSVYKNILDSKKVYDRMQKLGKISKIDYETMLLKEKHALLNYKKAKLELSQKVSLLDALNIDIASIDEDDINIYQIANDKLKKYVDYENEKIDNINNINYYTTLKSRIDPFLPDMVLEYSKGDSGSNIGFTISKTFTLADRKYIDNKLSENNKKIPKIKYEKELENYNLLKDLLSVSNNTYDLEKEKLELSKLELELGRISHLKYVETIESLKNRELELIQNKINLSKYILERE